MRTRNIEGLGVKVVQPEQRRRVLDAIITRAQQARTHARTHARARARAHTHTQT
jgi:hypothetical protein